MTLIPTTGSVLQIMPATGTVELRWPDGTRVELPLVGYGVVVGWTTDSDDQALKREGCTVCSSDAHHGYETSVEPLVLVEGRYVNTPRELADDFGEGFTLTVTHQIGAPA